MRAIDFSGDVPPSRIRAEIADLVGQGRTRTAMDLVLGMLRHRPGNRAVLDLALAVLAQGRSDAVRSVEPMGTEQRLSALLAPIATECTRCGHVWYSLHPATPGMSIAVTDPIGLQCQDCRYSLCRTCLGWRPLGNPEQPCPASGCSGRLTTPVLPTGRGDVTDIDPADIEAVVVAREGPVPPTRDEAVTVLLPFVPLVPDDAPLVHVRRSTPGLMWDQDLARNRLGVTLVGDLERAGTLAPGAWPRSIPLHLKPSQAEVDTDHLVVVVRRADAPVPPHGRLVHVQLLWEGARNIAPDAMTDLLTALSPRVFRDEPTIRSYPFERWPDDARELGLALLARDDRGLLADEYEIRTTPGVDGDHRWHLFEVSTRTAGPESHPEPAPRRSWLARLARRRR